MVKKINQWSELTKITEGAEISIERVRIKDNGIAIEGDFELPPLAQLTYEDQVFVAAFLKTHGSIKEMERLFGVSYPTIKSRLNAMGEKFGFLGLDLGVNLGPEVNIASEKLSRAEVLEKLERGEISAENALEMIKS